jgi:hypothetical protein
MRCLTEQKIIMLLNYSTSIKKFMKIFKTLIQNRFKQALKNQAKNMFAML